MNFYRQSVPLRHGKLTVLNPEADDVLVYLRATDADTLLLIVNVRNRPETVALPEGIRGRRWVEVFAADTLAADTLRLGPYHYRLYQPLWP